MVFFASQSLTLEARTEPERARDRGWSAVEVWRMLPLSAKMRELFAPSLRASEGRVDCCIDIVGGLCCGDLDGCSMEFWHPASVSASSVLMKAQAAAAAELVDRYLPTYHFPFGRVGKAIRVRELTIDCCEVEGVLW